MIKIHFENGKLVTAGYVIVNNVKYTVVEAEYSGETPLSAENLNQMQDNIEKAIEEEKEYRYKVTLTNDLADNSYITLPAYYKVGDTLQVYFELNKEIEYIEVGQTGHLSNQIRINSWGDIIDAGFTFSFIIKGLHEGGTS